VQIQQRFFYGLRLTNPIFAIQKLKMTTDNLKALRERTAALKRFL
jgi:hypothetical protein